MMRRRRHTDGSNNNDDDAVSTVSSADEKPSVVLNDSSSLDTCSEEDEDEYMTIISSKDPALKPFSFQVSATTVLIGGALLTVAALLYLANVWLSRLNFTRVVTLLPVAFCALIALRPGIAVEKRILPLTMVLTVIGTQLPAGLGCGLAAIAVVAFSLATMPPDCSSTTTTGSSSIKLSKARGMPDFSSCLRATVIMAAVLLAENFLIWVLSATFEPGWNIETAPPPLHDNGKTLIQHFFSNLTENEVLGLRKTWNTQWVLVVCLGASFFVVELFHPIRSLYSVGTRAFISIAIARFTRTVSFLLTVVPSQIEGCYDLRFPGSNPPPADWSEWLWVGFLPRTKGGCNDLIISGHAVIMSTIACVATSVANDKLFSVALWSMVFLDYCVVVFEGLHYSVDMWLGVILSSLLWRTLQPLEVPITMLATPINTSHHTNTLTLRNAIKYAPPAIVAYLQLVVLPMWCANIVILMYFITALTIYFKFVLTEEKESKKQPYMHYMQHVVLCVLFMALGIYL